MTSDARLVTLGPAHDAAALAIHDACPIEADFRVVFERHPRFFARPERLFDAFLYRGVEVEGELGGYAALGYREGWLPGGVGRYFYAGDARVLPEHRRRGLGELLRQDLVGRIEDGVDFGWNVVQVGNRAVQSWRDKVGDERVGTGWRALPMGRYTSHNLMFRGAGRPPRGGSCRAATRDDIEPLMELWSEAFVGRPFAPPVDAQRLRDSMAPEREPHAEGLPPDPPRYWVFEVDGRVVASAGAWDMEALHRARVLRLSTKAKLTRAAYQVLRRLDRNLTPLPRAGGSFRGLYLVDVAVHDRNPASLHGLLRGLLHQYRGRGYHFLHLGLLDGDPLEGALRGLFSTSFASDVHLSYRTHRADEVHAFADPYLDIALL